MENCNLFRFPRWLNISTRSWPTGRCTWWWSSSVSSTTTTTMRACDESMRWVLCYFLFWFLAIVREWDFFRQLCFSETSIPRWPEPCWGAIWGRTMEKRNTAAPGYSGSTGEACKAINCSKRKVPRFYNTLSGVWVTCRQLWGWETRSSRRGRSKTTKMDQGRQRGGKLSFQIHKWNKVSHHKRKLFLVSTTLTQQCDFPWRPIELLFSWDWCYN